MNPVSMLADAARGARNALDRLLHGSRRRALLRRIAERPPRSVLFICNGNICRSPFAEYALAARLAKSGVKVQVASAGFLEPNRPSPREAIEAARALGLDMSRHRSRPLEPALAGAADLVFVMDRWQRARFQDYYRRRGDDVRLLGDLDPAPLGQRNVTDPVDQPREVFDVCYARISRCIDLLAGALVSG